MRCHQDKQPPEQDHAVVSVASTHRSASGLSSPPLPQRTLARDLNAHEGLTGMAEQRRPSPSQMTIDSWVALGAGVGVMIGVVRDNVFLWVLIGAVAGLALVWPEDA
jgi:hypothetical protein